MIGNKSKGNSNPGINTPPNFKGGIQDRSVNKLPNNGGLNTQNQNGKNPFQNRLPNQGNSNQGKIDPGKI
ncbi:MAG: hypothetical protein R3C11_05095 [Planctomycetaceae bacterium]